EVRVLVGVRGCRRGGTPCGRGEFAARGRLAQSYRVTNLRSGRFRGGRTPCDRVTRRVGQGTRSRVRRTACRDRSRWWVWYCLYGEGQPAAAGTVGDSDSGNRTTR